MVVAAGIHERTATEVTQGMAHEPDLRPARAAKVFSVTPMDSAAAGTATRRVKPVNQPVQPIG